MTKIIPDCKIKFKRLIRKVLMIELKGLCF
jgi:hypothetical protein